MNAVTAPPITSDLTDHVLTLTFNATNEHNPFSAAMERELTAALKRADEDEEVHALILTGGRQRSFSAGGDFNEVRQFEGGDEVDRWIDDIVDMYSACLEVRKPTVGAIDRHAIGIGFQLALCCDYRIGTTECQLNMPELKGGIACVLGQYMLEKMLGRAQMQRIIIECERLSPEENLRLGLLNEICGPQELYAHAHGMARKLAAYPGVAYRVTKQEVNRTFVEGLRNISPVTKAAHRASFRDRAAQKYMARIVGDTAR